MLRRHMATKKKDMPKDLDSETPALEDDDVVDDEPEADDLEGDIDEDALVDLEDDDPLDDDDDIVEIDVDDDDVVGRRGCRDPHRRPGRRGRTLR
jgi:hypothetical protein